MTSFVLFQRFLSLLISIQEKPNPEYLIIDRILDKQVTKGKAKATKYLVKWKGLGYEECTWEPETELEAEEDLEIKTKN